jgi:predicted small lipoprotein YifL
MITASQTSSRAAMEALHHKSSFRGVAEGREPGMTARRGGIWACGRPRFQTAVLLLLIALVLAGCGKKGPPQLPPDEPNTYPRTYPSA